MSSVSTYVPTHPALISYQVSLHLHLFASEVPDRVRVVFAKIYTVVLLWGRLGQELALLRFVAHISNTVQLRQILFYSCPGVLAGRRINDRYYLLMALGRWKNSFAPTSISCTTHAAALPLLANEPDAVAGAESARPLRCLIRHRDAVVVD